MRLEEAEMAEHTRGPLLRDRITEVMYKHPGSLSVFKKFDDKEQPFMYIRFLTPDGRHIATVKDPPEASLEELLKRVIAIEDRLSK